MTLSLLLDAEIVEVGGRFDGQVTREPDSSDAGPKARSVVLSLRYFTSGRGDTDRQVVDKVDFPLQEDGSLDSGFALAVPFDAPISYDGSLIRVVWEIEARIDLRMARDPKSERSVLVIPAGGEGLYDSPHPLSQHNRGYRG